MKTAEQDQPPSGGQRRLSLLYRRFVEPKSADEDTRRREFIFNVLVLGTAALVAIALLSMVSDMVTQGAHYEGTSPLVVFVPLLIVGGLYAESRRRFRNVLPYSFVTLFLLLGTYALYLYGYVLAEGLLTYVLVIVMAGILISARAAWIMTACIAACLVFIMYVQTHGITHPDQRQLFDPLNLSDLIVYLVLFLVVLLASWLSNREIERSLRRARRSEAALKRERNSLEVKVRQRTRQLEQAQVEKMLELHRFAEFGRFTSTLLHELANPLTSVSLELEQLESIQQSAMVRQARLGVSHMEQYVEAARRQLRNQSEIKAFDAADEIRRVIEFLVPKARNQRIAIKTELASGGSLYGDSIRFNQIMANLIGNAIDAYDADDRIGQKQVFITTRLKDGFLQITVRDQGKGIPAADTARIFEPFYTTKPSERGTGIGLSITKRAVEADFKGSIGVTSSRTGGTVFKVRLPVYEV